MSELCPCGSQFSYSQCCGPLHKGNTARSAEQLMRSRYSAFCKGLVDYLLATTAAANRSAEDRSQIEHSIQQTQWRGLKVLKHSEAADHGEVEFVAFLNEKDQPQALQQLHELSMFEKSAGRWYYLDGKILPPIKLQRNDPCFCGSGKKYKKCCG